MKHWNSVNVLAQDNVSTHSNAVAVAENNHDWNFTVCKKIAQLTKVVYTLNCRVEDSDERTRFLISAHKVEMEQTKANYAHKVSALVEEVEQHKEESERAIKKMEEQYRKLMQEMKSEHDAKIRQMLMEVKENKNMFETKLKQNLEKTEKQNQEALNSLSANKDAEIQKLVVEYNDKYKSMLAEQLDAKDALEQQLNLEWSEKLKRVQMELGNKCNDLSGELSQRTQALRGAEKEQKQLAESQQSLLRVNQELNTQMEALKKAIYQKDLTIASCEQDLQNVIAEKKAQSDQLEALQKKLDQRLEETETCRHDLLEKERYAQKLISDITALSNTITAITTEKNAIAALNEEYLTELEKLQKSMSQLQEQLNATSSTAALNETAVHELQKALQFAKVNEEKLQEMLRKSEAEHALAIQSLSERMSKQAEEHQRCAEEAGIAAAEEWKKKLAEMMKKHELQTKELEERQTTLRSQLNNCKAELENKQNVIERLNKDVSLLHERNGEVCESLCRAQEQIKEAEDTRERECLSLQEQLDEAIRKSKEWEEMVNVNKQLSGVKNAAEIEELKRTFEAQKRELLEEHKRMYENAEKTQREKLELMEQQMEKSSSNHSSELSKLKAQHEEVLRQQMSELMQSEEMLKTKHNEEMESTRKLFARRLDEAEAVWLSQRKQLEYEKEELQSRLCKTEEYAHEREAESSQSTEAWHRELEQMSKQLQEMREYHEKELEKLRLETESKLHDSLWQQEQVHATKQEELRNELEKVQLTHEQEHERLVREHDKELATEKDKHERAMHQAVQSMMSEKAQQLTELTNMYTDQIKSLQRTSESALQLKHAELQKANNDIASLTHTLTDKNSALERTCEELQCLEQRRAKDVEKNAQILSDATILHENTIASLKSEHEMQIRKLGEIHQRIVDDLNVQMQQAQISHAANEAELRAALKLLQHKYDYRESRSEDVELINTLRTQVKEVQRALEKAYEDMKLYKLELINREENYNKLFSRTPLVAAHAQSLQQSMPELFAKNKFNTTAAVPAMTPTHDKSNSLPMLRKSTIHNNYNIVKQLNN